MNDNSVTRTASDALQAKASAICNAGYRPKVPCVEEYVSLVRQVCKDSSPKRQTPLVHAGYLLRTQAILSTVYNFIYYLRSQTNSVGDATIILLGCGLDVTGLWAATFPQIGNVIEIDLPTVCAEKRSILTDRSLVSFQETPTPNIQRGKLLQESSLSTESSTRFSLVEADIRKTIRWQNALESVWSPRCPTLVISEVVLAYVGQEATNCVLSDWAQALQNRHSCLVLLEPLGPSNDNSTQTNTVLKNYQLSYTKMFRDKMERGGKADPDAFTPIGSSPLDAARRVRKAGWQSVVAASVAEATQSAKLKIEEPFDEHAALLLHGHSYALVCAFSSSATSALFRRVMAPWLSPMAPFQPNNNFWVATIDRTEEENVKSIFVDGYADLAKTNKSVKKLVQSTFKKDIVLTQVDASMDGINFTSNFAKYHQDRRGCFLVAIDAKSQHIAGFIAISKAPHHAKGILSKHPNTFEVHRLFVVKEYRSQGVANFLMDSIQSFAVDQSPPGSTVTLVAATLNVLDAANRFYKRRGFDFEEELSLPEVTLYYYMLRISNSGIS